MGWYGTYGQSKKQQVAELIEGNENKKYVAHSLKGNHLWVVWDLGEKGKVIGLDLLAVEKGYAYNKPLDETMGPFYYDCPLILLEKAGEDSLANKEWRNKVVEYWADKANKKKKKVIGTKLRVKEGVGELAGLVFHVSGILPRKQACIIALGYRLKPSQVELV